MKAAVIAAPDRLVIQEIPPPVPGPGEALVRIEACGLCGTTDRHLVEGRQCHHPADRYPAVLGHEAVGVVVEMGANVSRFRVGDRVTRPVAIWPGTQRDGLWSAWGGFAQWGIVRETVDGDYTAARQQVVPPELSTADAVLAISVAEVASWTGRLGSFDGQTVAIGGTGFAACVMAQCVRRAGAARVVALGRTAGKFAWMEANGSTDCLPLDEGTPEALRERLGGRGADHFLDAAGHQAVFEIGLRCLRPGGQASIYGAPEGFAYRVPLGAAGGDFFVRCLQPADDTFLAEACRRLGTGEIDGARLRTHVWEGLDALPTALDEQAAGKVLKGVVMI